MSTSRSRSHRRYSREQKEHAVRLVRLRRDETGERHGSVTAVAEQLGFGPESVRVGLSVWSKKSANPTVTEIFVLDNGLAINHIPTSVAYGSVVF